MVVSILGVIDALLDGELDLAAAAATFGPVVSCDAYGERVRCDARRTIFSVVELQVAEADLVIAADLTLREPYLMEWYRVRETLGSELVQEEAMSNREDWPLTFSCRILSRTHPGVVAVEVDPTCSSFSSEANQRRPVIAAIRALTIRRSC
jgi:hypothetical protein